MKSALLLTNLGTPEAPTAEAVGPYLREFLSDPFVLTMPAPIRWALVNLLIVPRRSSASAENYKKIWTDRGSPLLFNSQDLYNALKKQLQGQIDVYLGMRYGKPSLESQIDSILQTSAEEIILLPLYPQYAESTIRTTVEKVKELLSSKGSQIKLKVIDRFYAEEEYLAAKSQLIDESLRTFKADHLLFSYHGVPVSHVKKTDPTKNHCDKLPQCCEKACEANYNCYRFHCEETTRGLLKHFSWDEERASTSFQSRLGPSRWLEPSTENRIKELAISGVKNLAVVCPAFTADCLETIEEIGQEGRETFLDHGGEDYLMIPCLNSHPRWVKAIENWVSSDFSMGHYVDF